MKRLLLLFFLPVLLPSAWGSKVELSTVPPREGVEVIIYRDVDLTLVREQRTIRFHQGENEVAFSWADTNIDPTSVRIRIAGDGAGYALTQTTYPPEQPNTLVWHITAPNDGPAPLEVSYFTSGLTWSASYTLILSYDEKEGTLAADFSIGNQSGEDYEKAKVTLLTGGVRLIEQVVALNAAAGEDLERAARPSAAPGGGMMADKAAGMGGFGGGYGGGGYAGGALGTGYAARGGLGEVAEEIAIAAGMTSEHERYALDTELGLLNGWVTRLRFAESDAAKPKVIARQQLFGGGPVARIVKVTNDKDHGLGTAPLPAGPVSVFKRDPSGRLVYLGDSAVPYAAMGQEVEFAAGVLSDIVIEPKMMGLKKHDFTFDDNGRVIGRVVEDHFNLKIRNRDAIAREMEIIHGRPGPANVVVGADDAERQAGQIKWKLTLDPEGQAEKTYQFNEYHGVAVNIMPQEGR